MELINVIKKLQSPEVYQEVYNNSSKNTSITIIRLKQDEGDPFFPSGKPKIGYEIPLVNDNSHINMSFKELDQEYNKLTPQSALG